MCMVEEEFESKVYKMVLNNKLLYWFREYKWVDGLNNKLKF